MNKQQFMLLIVLSALWGSSFMFMKVLSPVLGPIATASFRLLIGGSILMVYFKITKKKTDVKGDVWILFQIGVIGLALPYFCFAFAAQYIPSNLSAILNSTSPMFSFILGILLYRDKIRLQKVVGLVFGTIGVIIITGKIGNSEIIGIIAVLIASFLYGVSGVIVRSKARHIDSSSIGLYSQLFGGLFLLPFILFFPIEQVITIDIVVILVLFGFLTSAIALLIYYKLMKEIGPTKTLTVTYIMPLFAIIWGYVILQEGITLSTILGGITIVAGTILLTMDIKFINKKENHLKQ